MEKEQANKCYVGYWVRRFLCEYITDIRNCSRNTQKSYRDSMRLMINFLCRENNKTPDKLLVTDINRREILSFLDDVENTRNCSIRTRNQRLSAINAWATFISKYSPEHIEWCRELKLIPIKKSPKREITYLEKDEMDALLALPDKNAEQGWKDYVLLLFLYNTGARAEEASSLQIKDLLLPKGKGIPVVTLTGKGNKTRRCPLWETTKQALETLIAGRDPEERVFINRLHGSMTRFGVYEMVTKYARKLADSKPSTKGKRISPHTIRHTTATHLLQAGVDINTIRAWLGHVSVDTTNVYAEINLEIKEKALNACNTQKTDKPKSKGHWRNDNDLMSFLKNL